MALKTGRNYRRYQRYFVDLQTLYQKREIKLYTGLILSLLAVAFFGLFALRPTLTTIAGLVGDLRDKKAINQKLQEKINNLSRAQTNYSQTINSLELLDQALPRNPSVSQIAYQIEILAQKSNLIVRSINFESVNMKGESPKQKNEVSFDFTLSGDFQSLKSFLESLENLRRIITIKSFSLSKSKSVENQTMTLNVLGKAYFLPNNQTP